MGDQCDRTDQTRSLQGPACSIKRLIIDIDEIDLMIVSPGNAMLIHITDPVGHQIGYFYPDLIFTWTQILPHPSLERNGPVDTGVLSVDGDPGTFVHFPQVQQIFLFQLIRQGKCLGINR